MKISICTILYLLPIIACSQNEELDTIKMKLILDNQPLRGANIYIADWKNGESFNTDFEGEATIRIPKNKEQVRLGFMGPVVRLRIIRPVDSIVVNLNSKKARYYFNSKKMNKQKLKVRGY
ncbi:hypothetical protein [Flagellimonas allohymeniacidonis]|uniref:Uncharacterized protein n=1 Tax=Flagellimonas allohymeniacidonis TaxID=2517819 RepID=A0A4V2HSI1_9FLAO|nr:hypothetical protein [Allomuricauda hymeniacidonis]TAI47840.1 hypothetical protein EW142_14390 [Allomuricauda hymeniacidonis]